MYLSKVIERYTKRSILYFNKQTFKSIPCTLDPASYCKVYKKELFREFSAKIYSKSV